MLVLLAIVTCFSANSSSALFPFQCRLHGYCYNSYAEVKKHFPTLPSVPWIHPAIIEPYRDYRQLWKHAEKSDRFLGKIEVESSLAMLSRLWEGTKCSNGRNAKTYNRKENVSSYMRTNPVHQMTTHVQQAP